MCQIPVFASQWARNQQAVRSLVSERSRPAKTLLPVRSSGSPRASHPNGGGEERRRRFYALVEHEIAVLGLPRRHPAGVGGHRHDFAGVEEGSESRIGGPDRFLRERIKLGRRGVKPEHRRRIVALLRVVNEDALRRSQVGRRLHVEMMMLKGPLARRRRFPGPHTAATAGRERAQARRG